VFNKGNKIKNKLADEIVNMVGGDWAIIQRGAYIEVSEFRERWGV